MREQRHHCRRRLAIARAGSAGQDDRHARPKDDAAAFRRREIRTRLREQVARLQIGNDENVGIAGDRRIDLRRLDWARDLTMDSRDEEQRAPPHELSASLCTVRRDTVEAHCERHWRTAMGQATRLRR